jgi:hypothetical protein
MGDGCGEGLDRSLPFPDSEVLKGRDMPVGTPPWTPSLDASHVAPFQGTTYCCASTQAAGLGWYAAPSQGSRPETNAPTGASVVHVVHPASHWHGIHQRALERRRNPDLKLGDRFFWS